MKKPKKRNYRIQRTIKLKKFLKEHYPHILVEFEQRNNHEI